MIMSLINFATITFMVEAIVFSYMAIVSFRRYINIKYSADLQVMIASILAIIDSFLRVYITFLDNIDNITLIYRFINFILMIEIFFFYIAFTIYYKNKIGWNVVIFGFITGILTGAFLYDPSFKVAYDEPTQAYNGVYSNTLLLFILPLILFAFIRVIQPLLRKAKVVNNADDRKQLFSMSIGILIILIWGFSAALTFISVLRMLRPLIFVTGWAIWFIAGQSNPFFLSISNAKPLTLYISDETGLLYYNYNFEETQKYDAELVTPLVSAINSIANDVFQSKSGIESFKMGDSFVTAVKLDKYYFHLLSTDLDNTLEGMLRYFAKSSLPRLNSAKKNVRVDLDDIVENTFLKLLIISKDVKSVPEINN